jgi:hypothetical protein
MTRKPAAVDPVGGTGTEGPRASEAFDLRDLKVGSPQPETPAPPKGTQEPT